MRSRWCGTDGTEQPLAQAGWCGAGGVGILWGSRTFLLMALTSEWLTANEAKSAIYDLADEFSWETVAKEMVARMSGDEARDFLSDFKRLYDA